MNDPAETLVSPNATVVAPLTAPGPGAVAVAALVGPAAATVLCRCLRSCRALDRALASGLAVARWLDGETVVLRARSKEDLEISCHGGRIAIERLIQQLAAAGATRVSPQQLLKQRGATTFDVELLDALRQAPSRQAAFAIAAQPNRWANWLDQLLSPSCPHPQPPALVLQRALAGPRLFDPWHVTIAGRPNVGKSSLLNAVAGYARAIVDEQAGTTRDVVQEQVIFRGWPLRLHDTAGLRWPADPIEREGVRRATQALRHSDLVWLVLDRSEPLGAVDRRLLGKFPEAIVVANKSDLAAQWDPSRLLGGRRWVSVSARTATGLDQLLELTLAELLPHGDPLPDGPLALSARQTRLVQLALRHVLDGQCLAACRAIEMLLSRRASDPSATSPQPAPSDT